MKTEVVRAQIEPEVKAEAYDVLEGLGVKPSTYIRMALLELIARRAIPFNLTYRAPREKEAA